MSDLCRHDMAFCEQCAYDRGVIDGQKIAAIGGMDGMDRDDIFRALGEAAEELAKMPSHQVCVGCGKKRPFGLVVQHTGEDGFGAVEIGQCIPLREGDDQRPWCLTIGGKRPGDYCPDCRVEPSPMRDPADNGNYVDNDAD